MVPEADAKLQTGTVSVGAPGARGDQVLTQIFKLNHENPNNLVAVLRPLISPNNTINANPGNNTLVITDYADNLQRIGSIIAALDTPGATDVEVIPLQHARGQRPGAAGAAPGRRRRRPARRCRAPPARRRRVHGAGRSARSNALIVRAANPARMAAMRAHRRSARPAAAGRRPGAATSGSCT